MRQCWKDKFSQDNRYFETDNGILYCGDCLEIMKKFPKKIFDAIITDPPYGITNCKWDSIIPFDGMWRELKRIRKDKTKTPIVLFGGEPFSSYLRISNIKEYKYDWVWNKKSASNFANAKRMPLRVTENIIVFGGKTYYPIKTKGKFRKKGGGKVFGGIYGDKRASEIFHGYWNDNYYPKNIIEISNADRSSKVHPTQKPLALLEYLVKTYTLEQDLVLDFTCGSGTTLVVCEKLNRRWVGIEILKEYCEIAKERIKNELKQISLDF